MKNTLYLLSLLFLLPFQANSEELNVLFIGNSYTARHNLATVVKDMAEAGNPGLTFNTTSVIYGGRTLKDHWRLGTQHIVNQHSVTKEEIEATVKSLQEPSKDPKDKYAPAGLKRQSALLKTFKSNRDKWDIIVLQSYRDDLNGEDSLYMQYAPRYAELAKAQGARVILYTTTPTTQNAEPLTSAPDKKPIFAFSKTTGRRTATAYRSLKYSQRKTRATFNVSPGKDTRSFKYCVGNESMRPEKGEKTSTPYSLREY